MASTVQPVTKQATGNVLPTGAARALATVLIFSLLMVTVPFALYFSSYEGYFDKLYGLTFGIPAREHRAVASAILAVVGVNVVVGTFIFVAFKEVTTDEPEKARAEAKKND